MSKVPAVITLNEAVESYLVRSRTDTTEHIRYFELFARGYRDIRRDVTGQIESVVLPMDVNNVVYFPDDMIQFVAIGIPYAGKLWTFTREKHLMDQYISEDGEEIIYPDGVSVGINNGIPTGYSVRGGVNDYYYNIDHNNRRIIINGFPRTDVILKYKSTGIELSGDTYIPVYLEMVLEAYARWRVSDYDGEPRTHVRDKQNIYEELRKEARRLSWPTLREIRDKLLQMTTRAPLR